MRVMAMRVGGTDWLPRVGYGENGSAAQHVLDDERSSVEALARPERGEEPRRVPAWLGSIEARGLVFDIRGGVEAQLALLRNARQGRRFAADYGDVVMGKTGIGQR